MPEPIRLAIAENLTIYNALAHKQRLVVALDEASAIELDLAEVEEMDTAGLQILLFAKREATRCGKTLSIMAYSPSVRQTIEFCNLTSFFDDSVAATAAEPM